MGESGRRGGSRFVVVCDEDCTNTDLTELLELFDSRKYKYSRISREQGGELEPGKYGKNVVYILTDLRHASYNNIIGTIRGRVMTPTALLHATKRQLVLNQVTSKVLQSVSMVGVKATSTGLDERTKTRVSQAIELMGGAYGGDLTENTTHLVCDTVGSKKYLVAASRRMPIVSPKWATHAYDRVGEMFSALDPRFVDKFRVPVFAGCVISVTGISIEERNAVKHMVVANGGQYSPELINGKVTHLIVKEPGIGQKFDAARQWSIPCVSISWFNDSIDRGLFQDPNLYKVTESENSVHTPGGLSSSLNTVPATVGRRGSSFSSLSQLQVKDPHLLSFVKAHLVDLEAQLEKEVENLIAKSGGSIYKQFQPGVTHVICSNAAIGQRFESEHDVSVITPQWVLDCVEQAKLVPLDKYLLGPSPAAMPSELMGGAVAAKVPKLSALPMEVDDELSRSYLQSPLAKATPATSKLASHTSVPGVLRDCVIHFVDKADAGVETARGLGASVRTTLTQDCTHLVMAGDTRSEGVVARARSRGVFLVTSDWLDSCSEKNERVPELPFTPQSSRGGRTSRSRSSRTLKALQPNPIPTEDIAMDSPVLPASGEDRTLASDSQPSKQDTPSKLGESIMQRLAILRNTPTTEPSTPSGSQPSSQQKSAASVSRMASAPAATETEEMPPPPLLLPSSHSDVTRHSASPECSQSVQIGWETDNIVHMGSSRHCNTAASVMPKISQKRVFQFSSLTAQKKSLATVLIQNLGGETAEELADSMSSVTHLIAENPSKGEKYLSACARGLWVLTYDYIIDSGDSGRWLSEADYEWGSERVGLATIHPHHHKVALAAGRWRRMLSHQHSSAGAFANWRVLLYVSKNKMKGLSTILKCGGASILSTCPPFTNFAQATHAFIEASKVDMGAISCSQLSSAGVRCCRPEYIADFLVLESPAVENYLVQDAQPATQTASRSKPVRIL